MLGQENPEMNFILETVNGVVLILSISLLLVLTFYIASKLRQNNQPLRRVLANGPMRATVLALALALLFDKLGVLLTRVAVFTWRRFGNGLTGGPMNEIQIYLLLIGTPLSAIGLLWLIRILSRPMYGDWPWTVTAIVAGCYLAVTFWQHYHLIGALL